MFKCSTVFLLLRIEVVIVVICYFLRFGWSWVVMNLVNDVVLLVYVRNTVFIKFFCVLIHVELDLLKWKANWLLNLNQVLHFLNLVYRKLVFLSVQNTFIAKHFLSFLFSNNFLRTLLSCIQSQRCLVQSKRIKKLCFPVGRVEIHFEISLFEILVGLIVRVFRQEVRFRFFFNGWLLICILKFLPVLLNLV